MVERRSKRVAGRTLSVDGPRGLRVDGRAQIGVRISKRNGA